MRKILTRLFICLLAVCSFLFAFKVVNVEAANITTIDVHYFRYDDDYNNYFVWFWTESQTGVSKQLTKSDKNGYPYHASIAFKGEVTEKIGVIFVKMNSSTFNWDSKKEQTDDIYFYIDPDKASGSTLDVYYAQGDNEVHQDASEAALAKKNKFLYLSFTGDKEITYKSTKTVTSNSIKVYEDGNLITSSATYTFDQAGKVGRGKITLTKAIDYTKDYAVDATIAGDAVDKAEVSFVGLFGSGTSFEQNYTYDGDDLGASYTPAATTFKLWAPLSRSIKVLLYTAGHKVADEVEGHPGADEAYAEHDMVKGEKGVWSVTVEGDLDGKYYTYEVHNSNQVNEVVDPYAKTTGLNGLRGMVIDFFEDNEDLNPAKWKETPRAVTGVNNVDKVIYETQMRDLTAHETWGGTPEYAGTYMGLTEKGTSYTENGVNVKTGLDHLIELGVTHVHFLPLHDSEYVDERRLHDKEYLALEEDGIYNWGYMSRSFFALEGAFSTNPYDGYARMKEYKTLIRTFHAYGISVVMDVVFNHSASASNSNYNYIVPKYYHRTSEGYFTNGSGCGNELASERSMVRKLIVDSCTYFVDEFKVDGYRFDLMALEDTDTMRKVLTEVKKIDKNSIIYGEPWTGDGTPGGFGNPSPANQGNMSKMTIGADVVAAFNDASREGIRGSNDTKDSGWIMGNTGMFNKTVWGLVGGQNKFNDAYTNYNLNGQYGNNQIINYVSCHDNYTLFDQITLGADINPNTGRKKAHTAAAQAISMVVLGMGVPFIEGGSEIARTKSGNHNSYNAGDIYNVFNYRTKVMGLDQFNSIKDMIAIRRSHVAFRQATYSGVNTVMKNNTTLWFNDGKIIAYRLQDTKDDWKDIYVVHANMAASGQKFASLPAGTWRVAASTNPSRTRNSIFKNNTSLAANETVVLVNSKVDISVNMPNSRPVIEGEGDPTQSTYEPAYVNGKLVKPANSTNANDIAKVFEVCYDLVQKGASDVSSCYGSAKNAALAVANQILDASSGDFKSTDAVYNIYESFYNSRIVLMDARRYANEVPCMPKAVMADFYSRMFGAL